MTSQISTQTKLCLVIGDPVAHSLSPLLHNTAYAALGLSEDFVYLAARVSTSDLGAAISGLRALGVRGASLTIPHKVAVIPLLDEIDPLAQRIGAVNTIVNEHGKLKGFNTDAQGVVAPLEKITTLTAKNVALIGAGGAARAALAALLERHAAVTIFNRTAASATDLGAEFGVPGRGLTTLSSLQDFDIIVQATSIGMSPNISEAPFDPALLKPEHIVFDLVYNPLNTKLLQAAKALNCTTISGVEMFIEQGAAQFELWTGIQAPREYMHRTILDYFSSKKP